MRGSSTSRKPLWVFPLISATVWFCMLWAMLIVWLTQGRPHYRSMDRGTIAYISDIGAFGLYPLFIAGCSITALFFFLSLLSVRANHTLSRRLENRLDVLSIVFAAMGCVSLILLSVFNTDRYPGLHRLFLFLFMLGIILSAIFSVFEWRRLGRTFAEKKVIRHSYIAKGTLLVVEFLLSIAFGVCLYKRRQNAGAIIEWLISFVFTFYVLTFFFDLRPSAGTKLEGGSNEEVMREEEMRESLPQAGSDRLAGQQGGAGLAPGQIPISNRNDDLVLNGSDDDWKPEETPFDSSTEIHNNVQRQMRHPN